MCSPVIPPRNKPAAARRPLAYFVVNPSLLITAPDPGHAMPPWAHHRNNAKLGAHAAGPRGIPRARGNNMQQRSLGNSGLRVSLVGLGCNNFGQTFGHQYE